MPVYVVTGKLGGGKSLVSVARLKAEYLDKGLKVATNLDLWLHHMYSKTKRNLNVMRLPDKPQVHDLDMIGIGNPTRDESKNGALFLDEAGTWFNSRNWSDRSRGELINKLLHIRKLGWDMYLIIQDIDLLDSQARAALAEHVVFCRRLDRIAIPYVGRLIKLVFGVMPKGPRIHMARVVYGDSKTALLADSWTYRGNQHFRSYDTKQLFRYREPGPMTMLEYERNKNVDPREKGYIQPMSDDYFGVHCMLTPWHLLGRYQKPWTRERVMRLTQIYLKKFNGPMTVAAGVLLGLLLNLALLPWSYNLMREAAKNEALETVEENAGGTVGAVAVGQEGTEVGTVADPEPEQDMAAVFADYFIAAHVRSEASRYYLLKSAEGPSFTDLQLRSMGYRVFYVSDCEIMLTAAEDISDKASIFAPGCIPKPKDFEPVDLSQFSTLRKKVDPLIPTTWAQNVQQSNGVQPVSLNLPSTAGL